MQRSESENNPEGTQKIADIRLGKAVMETAKILGLTDQQINDAVNFLISNYKVFFLKPLSYYSDFQKRITKVPPEVSPAEFIGHAMRTKATALKTFSAAYETKDIPHREKIIQVIKAMVYHDDYYLFLDTASGESIKKQVKQEVGKYTEAVRKAEAANKSRIADEVEAHKAFLKDSRRIPVIYERLVKGVSGDIVNPTSMLSVSQYAKDSVDVYGISWDQLAGYIRKHISDSGCKNIIIDPSQWDSSAQARFRHHVSIDIPARKMHIVGDSVYMDTGLEFESDMLKIFISAEVLEKRLLDISRQSTAASLSAAAAAASASSLASGTPAPVSSAARSGLFSGGEGTSKQKDDEMVQVPKVSKDRSPPP
ncbi:hypothetical protein AQUSIP_08590 [Aquicella siphonis]|uniref:Uncharacterized protein n=1 Tax=Aquicella siphonis TaxID=254247 RepID=A0A5E4PF06_9COXI|nr:hypothetical protein [Aquicella siphonis]VVC75569.1 hypothetical protein AQUSIP_08590 [Aquicella siphonis]